MKLSKIALIIAVMVMVVSLFVVGCGGSSGGPADAARDFFKNMFSDKVGDYICKSAGDEAMQALGMLGALSTMAGGVKIEMNTDGMKFQTVKEDDKKAVVKVSGKMKISVAGQTMEEEFPEQEIPMVKEDGKWKVCGM